MSQHRAQSEEPPFCQIAYQVNQGVMNDSSQASVQVQPSMLASSSSYGQSQQYQLNNGGCFNYQNQTHQLPGVYQCYEAQETNVITPAYNVAVGQSEVPAYQQNQYFYGYDSYADQGGQSNYVNNPSIPSVPIPDAQDNYHYQYPPTDSRSTYIAPQDSQNNQLTDSDNSQRREVIYDIRTNHNIPQDWLDNICHHFIDHMNRFGICVIDNFLGSMKGDKILKEVLRLYETVQYTSGSVANSKLSSESTGADTRAIRSDRVIWIEGSEDGCSEINNLIQTLCSVMINSARLSLYSNSALDQIVINKRTKAHVTCYPGNGARYVKHIDNPNGDGRLITSIYYPNRDWDTKREGGLLRILPIGIDEVANIEPLFDRVLFFWSDRRNPHEVLPTYKDRYAITVWFIGENRASENRTGL